MADSSPKPSAEVATTSGLLLMACVGITWSSSEASTVVDDWHCESWALKHLSEQLQQGSMGSEEYPSKKTNLGVRHLEQ